MNQLGSLPINQLGSLPGIAEPAYHYLFFNKLTVTESHSVSNVLAITYFHWGLHAWSIYTIVGLSYAWFRYIRNRDLS
ncbi:hypothetical protein FA893_17070 [Photobacterium damselae subsp. piscicida]|nr:hypothetical protein E4T25_18140 [Photobacterium damselae subsp. piscicida]TJZ83897.1 hypothetical protein FA893_17070 [Photobacterium damselae subsp. piscicida]